MDRIEEFLSKDRFAALLGITVESASEDGRCTVAMPFEEKHQNGLGNAHGGVIFTLADMAFGLGCYVAGLLCVSAQCSISYLSPGFGRFLRAESTPVKIGRSLVVCEITIYGEHGRKVAVATMNGFIVERAQNADGKEMSNG